MSKRRASCSTSSQPVGLAHCRKLSSYDSIHGAPPSDLPAWESHPTAKNHGHFSSVLIHRNSAAVSICPGGVKLESSELPMPRENSLWEHVAVLAVYLGMFM